MYSFTLAFGHFGQESRQVKSKWLYWIHCKLCDIFIALCWQPWRDNTEETAVAVNKSCHFYCSMLAAMERQHWRDCCGCEQKLPWCWTEEAGTWISQPL